MGRAAAEARELRKHDVVVSQGASPMHLRWIVFALAAAALGWPSGVAAQASRPSELVKALREFDEQKRGAQDALLASFDVALERLGKGKVGVDDRIALVEAVAAEKERFQKRGLIPWSPPTEKAFPPPKATSSGSTTSTFSGPCAARRRTR